MFSGKATEKHSGAVHEHNSPLRSTPHETLFSYSSGRFLYNEQARLRERCMRFDVSALEKAIETHVGHGSVKTLVKISEGGFNRVLSATMEDGFRAIVKIPFWISVPKAYATASEVATLTFLRSKGIPVPKVYGWSSTTDNLVGVEYVIMEHALGVGADTRWFNNTKHQKHALVTGIVDIEKKLFNIPFGAVGSLYFKSDLPPRLQGPLYVPGTPDETRDSDTYCIGPIADYMFWYGKRAELELDRGPCMPFLGAKLWTCNHPADPSLRDQLQQLPSCNSWKGSQVDRKIWEAS
jgi:hypothetical protein